jgi:ureidoglycolate lyase
LDITLAPLTETAIAPFGAIIQPPAEPGLRNFYTSWLGSERTGMTPRLHVNKVMATTLPCTIDTLERHPHSSQIFIPLDVTRYIVVVAPEAPNGGPDITRVQAFLAPGNVGIVYRQGVWHAGASVLDGPGSFAVLMWRNDTPDDEEFVPLAHKIELHT